MQLIFIALILFCCACTHTPYEYCSEGAEEFVLDSYRIKQGKFSILELEGACFDPLPPYYMMEYEDTIDEDDILGIALHHPTRNDLIAAVERIGASLGYRVIAGTVQLPNLQPVRVKGLTLAEAKKEIESAYRTEIANVEIFLEYRDRMHSQVELTGAVRIPEIPVNGRMRLYDVLAKAGVPNSANFFKSYVIRDGCYLPIDLYKLMVEGNMCQNIVMRPKDKIFIADASAASVMVLGEVSLPKVVPVPSGTIPLREALAAAGGIPFTGDKRAIQVIRGNIINPKIYTLSWNHITYLPNDSLLLMPGDTVYVSEKPITMWNRFIEQLLPSSLLIDVGVQTKRLLR